MDIMLAIPVHIPGIYADLDQQIDGAIVELYRGDDGRYAAEVRIPVPQDQP